MGGIRFSKDGNVRFAPRGSYTLGEHTPEQLAKQGDVVANYGVEGAEKLGEIAESTSFKFNPITLGINIDEGGLPLKRIAGITSSSTADVGRLYVVGEWSGLGDIWSGGCAYGMSR